MPWKRERKGEVKQNLSKSSLFAESFPLITATTILVTMNFHMPFQNGLKRLWQSIWTIRENISIPGEFEWVLWRKLISEELEQAKTADAYWNAAQLDMAITGRMPNYLRMYWGKKIIEWSKTYDEAWKNLAYLNNKYHIDGRDANSWCNFAWCFGAKDRPWFERPILGQLR